MHLLLLRRTFCLLIVLTGGGGLPWPGGGLALYAQSAEATSTNLEQTGVWFGTYLKVKLTNRLGYYAEHHLRTTNQIDRLANPLGRPGTNYNRIGLNILINDHLEAVVGFTMNARFSPRPGDPAFETAVPEPRIWSQALFKTEPMGRLYIYHQIRIEQRWRRENPVGAPYRFTNRWRYKFLAYIPLNTPKIEPGTWYVSPSAEIFMQSGKSVVYNPMEDFRVYTGVGYVLNNTITFFAGHMWTLAQKSTGYEYATRHLLRLNVYVGLDRRPVENRLPNINIGY